MKMPLLLRLCGPAMALFAMVGCPPSSAPPTEVVEHVNPVALVERYNARVGKVDQLWARAVMEMHWVDERGAKRFEQGDGKLILRKPDDLALAVGKFDETMLWVGCDAKRYWLMELRPPEGQPRTAYVGARGPNRPAQLSVGGLPIAPDQLMRLLGIEALPLPGEQGVSVSHRGPATVITLRGDKRLGGLALRTVIEEATARPQVIELVGDQEVVLIAQLSRYRLMERQGVPKGEFPYIATRIETIVPAEQSRIVLTLSDATDGRQWDRVKDAQFDFAKLTRLLKVERVVEVK